MGANIPLPALDTRTQFPNPLDEYMRAVQLKGAQQEQQLRAGQIQQQQYELQDQATLRSLAPKFVQKDAQGNVTGYDHDGLINAATQSGVNPNTLMKMEMQRADMRDKLAQASTHELDAHDKANDQLFQLLEGVRSAAKQSPEQAQSAWQNALPRAQKLGADPSSLPAQFPTQNQDAFVDQIESSLALHKQVIADARNQQETKKSVAQTTEAEAGTAEKKAATAREQATTKYYQEHGGAPGVPAEIIQQNDWLEKHPGKGPSDYKKYLSTLPINTRYALETGAGIPPAIPNATPEQSAARNAQIAQKFGMTPEAFDQTAEKYGQTGQLPTAGRGISGIAMNRALMNRYAELHPGASLAEGSAEFKANQQALGKLQTTADQVGAFEKTAGKNMDLYLEKLENIPDLKVKFLNTPIRAINEKMIGTQAYQEMKAAQQTASAEVAKVLSSANASGVLSDTQKKEAEDILSGNLSLNAARGVVATLHQDMGNRSQSYQDQINDIKGRMKTKPAGPAASSTTSQKVAPGGKAPRNADGTINWSAYDK